MDWGERQVRAWVEAQGEAAAFRGAPERWRARAGAGFRVIGESADYIAVDKPAPLQVHPAKPGQPPTLLDGLQELLAYEVVNGARLSIINRLDRETSGVVLVAKNREAARVFGRAMMRREVRKEYRAVVFGWPRDDHFEVGAPLLRQGEVEPTRVYLKQRVHPCGSPCRTEFVVLERVERGGRRLALVLARPHTGRMHQIRVHLAHAGHPVVGDKLYGVSEDCYLEFIERGWTPALEERLLLPRQALHSSLLAMETEEWGRLQWEAPLPPELRALISAPPAPGDVAAAR